MGIRFQTEPGSPPSEIMLHVRMWDKEAVLQQEALGLIHRGARKIPFAQRPGHRPILLAVPTQDCRMSHAAKVAPVTDRWVAF